MISLFKKETPFQQEVLLDIFSLSPSVLQGNLGIERELRGYKGTTFSIFFSFCKMKVPWGLLESFLFSWFHAHKKCLEPHFTYNLREHNISWNHSKCSLCRNPASDLVYNKERGWVWAPAGFSGPFNYFFHARRGHKSKDYTGGSCPQNRRLLFAPDTESKTVNCLMYPKRTKSHFLSGHVLLRL